MYLFFFLEIIMSNCIACGNKCWVHKDKFSSRYCEDCRVTDTADSYISNLAIKLLVIDK